jgi:hypothetical protein
MRHIASKKPRNLTYRWDPEGELARRDPSSPQLASLEAKALIFITNIIILIVIITNHHHWASCCNPYLTLRWICTCIHSIFDFLFIDYRFMMMLFAFMCE